MSDKKENTVSIDGVEIKESELTDKQKYLTSQCRDLLGKKSRIEFELDQVQASLNVFQQALVETTKETAEEILEEGEE
jgi:hypothetical protein|tara:strand:- start:724 stop:957 length:234 start_codon:yes stop_codon:yes gene_type:complete